MHIGSMTNAVAAAIAMTIAGASVAAESDVPAAHDPQFSNKSLWPRLSGKEFFLQPTWPKGRLYVWAHPGTSGGRRFRGALDVTEAANWLLDGKPAEELVLDESTDLWFPASTTRYAVGFRGTDVREVCRHVTIESGAAFIGGGDGVGRNIYGNVWIKRGGGMDAQGATRFLGPHHTFFRNDNTVETARSMGRGDGIMSSQYFTFNKEDGASVEFLGHVSVLDEFQIHGCMVIVGPGSILQPGRNASPAIHQGGVLALMDGATFESWNNDFGTPEMTVHSGAIQGGLPARPLRQSCKFGLAFKNHTAAQYEHASEKMRDRILKRVPALIVHEGTLRSYSEDVNRARLVFTRMADQDIAPRPGTERYEDSVKRWPEKKAEFAWLSRLPRGLDCFLGKDVVVDGVEFDYFRAGGVMVMDLASKTGWSRVFFGPNCAGSDAKLFRQLDDVGRSGQY